MDLSVGLDPQFPDDVLHPHACGAVSPGSASDYGVQKALSETTLAMLQAHGATKTLAEKENTKVRGVFSESCFQVVLFICLEVYDALQS